MQSVRKLLVATVTMLVACAVPLLGTPSPAGANPAPTAPGYWLAAADGGVFSYGAPFYGSGSAPVGALHLLPPAAEHARRARSGVVRSPPRRPAAATGSSTCSGSPARSARPPHLTSRAAPA